MSWVRVPPEAAHFFLRKVTALGVLCCFALFVCLTFEKGRKLASTCTLDSVFLHIHMYRIQSTCTCKLPSFCTGIFINNVSHILVHVYVHVYVKYMCMYMSNTCACMYI